MKKKEKQFSLTEGNRKAEQRERWQSGHKCMHVNVKLSLLVNYFHLTCFPTILESVSQ